jgi:hypothetical protein
MDMFCMILKYHTIFEGISCEHISLYHRMHMAIQNLCHHFRNKIDKKTFFQKKEKNVVVINPCFFILVVVLVGRWGFARFAGLDLPFGVFPGSSPFVVITDWTRTNLTVGCKPIRLVSYVRPHLIGLATCILHAPFRHRARETFRGLF